LAAAARLHKDARVARAAAQAFEALCASRDIAASQVVRQLIRDYLARHGVQYARSNAQNAD